MDHIDDMISQYTQDFALDLQTKETALQLYHEFMNSQHQNQPVSLPASLGLIPHILLFRNYLPLSFERVPYLNLSGK